MSEPLLPLEQSELSLSGRARSEEILGELQGRLGRAVARERLVRRSVAVAAALSVAGLSAWAVWPRPASVSPLPAPPIVRGHEGTPTHPEAGPAKPPVLAQDQPAPERRVYVRVVSTQPGALTACENRPAVAPAVACELSDKQLLSALAETGSTFGLVRVKGRMVVIKDGRPLPEQGG